MPEGQRKLFAYFGGLLAVVLLAVLGTLDATAASAIAGLFVAFAGGNAAEHLSYRVTREGSMVASRLEARLERLETIHHDELEAGRHG